MILLGATVLANASYSFPVTEIVTILNKVIASQLKQEKSLDEQLKIQKYNLNSLSNFTISPTDTKVANMVRSMNTFDGIKRQSGSLESHLAQYQSAEYYKKMPCFNGNSCSQNERKKLIEQRNLNSENQKNANKAVLRSLEQQQLVLNEDARKLMKLQQDAKFAKGQTSSLQAANELSASQNEQLLQLRALLVSQQTAQALKEAEEANQKAQQEAASEIFRKVEFKRIQPKKW